MTARVRVAGGGSLTILGIPSGTSYTVSEADYTADRYTTTSTGAVGVVETAAVRATFLNTRANPGYGALTVTKTVEAIGGAEIANGIEAEKVIDAAGSTVTPGLFDTHVHTLSLIHI